MGICSAQTLHTKNGKYLTGAIRENENSIGELEGQFLGSAVKRLGLDGAIIKHNDQRVNSLLKGINPENLQQLRYVGDRYQYINSEGNLQTRKPVTAIDLTFSPHETVTDVWVTSNKKTSLDIEAEHRKAVREVATYVQEHLCISRASRGGEAAEKVAPIFCRIPALYFQRKSASAPFSSDSL
jgi:TrwC relaxase